MLVFIDESGDPGLRVDKGASRSFALSLVVFKTEEDALACDRRITKLRQELGWPKDAEFHFRRNSDRIREVFLRAIASESFFYYGIVVHKDSGGAWQGGFIGGKEAFYRSICAFMLECAKETLCDATLVIDRSGGRDFRRRLMSQLKRTANTSGSLVKKIKMQDSKGNNLLQLADYVASVINRSATSEVEKETFRRIIIHHEVSIQAWPK